MMKGIRYNHSHFDINIFIFKKRLDSFCKTSFMLIMRHISCKKIMIV